MRQLMVLDDLRPEWRDVPRPQLTDPGDALVRPIALSICDADVAILRGKMGKRSAYCFGHEFVADVIEVGDAVTKFAPGDRVVVSFMIACGRCARCKRGYPAACMSVPRNSAYGFGIFGDWGGAASDLVRAPYADYMMARLPEGVSATAAASAGDNLSDAFRCVADGLEEEPGSPVLIVAGGGGGPSISLYAAAIAVALGSERVDYMDSDPTRLAIAETLGANPIEAGRAPERYGEYWITADTSGHPSGEWLATALRSTAPYGRCTSCGVYHKPVALPLNEMYLRGVRFTIGWANVQALMPKVLALLADRSIDVGRIHTVAAWDDAIEALKDPPAKLILARPEAR
jgi:alcohol dehydrogenase